MGKRKLTYYGAGAIHNDDEIIVCAMDTETRGLGGELLMVQWGTPFDGITLADGPDMVQRFFDAMFEMPYPAVWFSHFAQYDWRYFIDALVNMEDVTIGIGLRTDVDIYEIRIKRGKERYILRDSYAIFNSTLADLARRFCPELPKLEIDIANFDPKNEEHRAYARRDIEVMLKGLPKYFSLISTHFGVNPTGTTAGTALKAWQKTVPDKFNSMKYGPQELFIRQGYYGGLVFLTTTQTQQNCETYDLNSSYPASMCEFGVPYGRMYECSEFENEKMGIYRVRVRAPRDLVIPILPARDSKGAMRWYRGEFDTVVTNRELVFAAKHGYQILKVYEGFAFEEIAYPFNFFVEQCKEIRRDYKGQPEEFVAKLMQNSLYGKFGSRRERLQMLLSSSMSDDDYIDATPFDDDGYFYVRKETDVDMRAMPHWAAFITAHSRLRLLQAAYTVGVENCFYGDTDSLTIRAGYGHLLNVGDDYGQWKFEKSWQEFRAIAPKVYSGILADGTRKGAAKGLPRSQVNDDVLQQLLEVGHSEVSALSLASLKTHIKKGGSQAITLTRKSSSLRNSVNYDVFADGTVRAKIA